ncbi:MAG: hypothetical protein ACREM1_24835 [Longimicrobiales bacterium]
MSAIQVAELLAALAKRARTATGLSQTAFAERYQIPLSTFRQ